jgi:hypothetical protein
MSITKEDIHKHLDILQTIIGRMASNSASCKNYCITLVGALLALEQVKKEGSLIFLAFVPIIAFAFLDMYYLYLETFFRGQYNSFVKTWQTKEELEKADLFVFGKPKTGWPAIKESFYQIRSISIWPFYGFLLAVVLALLIYTYCQNSVVVC